MAGRLAAYMAVAGIEGLPMLPFLAHTLGFDVLLASLLLLVSGYGALDSPAAMGNCSSIERAALLTLTRASPPQYATRAHVPAPR